MPADALASIDIALIFSAIFLRSRSTLERLPSASDRLPPDSSAGSRSRCRRSWLRGSASARSSRVQASAERHADRLGLDDGVEFAAERLGRVGGDHLDRFEQRQAGLDAAHDDVDGVGSAAQEFLLAALLQEARDSSAAGRSRRRSRALPRPGFRRPRTASPGRPPRPRTAGYRSRSCCGVQSRPACPRRALSADACAPSGGAHRAPSASSSTCLRRERWDLSAWRLPRPVRAWRSRRGGSSACFSPDSMG